MAHAMTHAKTHTWAVCINSCRKCRRSAGDQGGPAGRGTLMAHVEWATVRQDTRVAGGEVGTRSNTRGGAQNNQMAGRMSNHGGCGPRVLQQASRATVSCHHLARSSTQSAMAALILSLPGSRTRMCQKELMSRNVLSLDCGRGEGVGKQGSS